MDISPEDKGKGAEPPGGQVTENDKMKKELALQAALNAEAERKSREAGGAIGKPIRPPIEKRDADVERKLSAMMAERMAQEEETPAPSRGLKKMIPVIAAAMLITAAVTAYAVYPRAQQESLPPAAVEKPSEPAPLTPPNRTRVNFKLGQNTLMVNDTVINMDVAPQNIDGRVMLPLSYVAAALNCQVEWAAPEQKVSLKSDSRLIEVWIGKSTARINGQEVVIDPSNQKVTPMIVPPGRTMVPLRFLAESLGSQVDWNQEEQAVTITN